MKLILIYLIIINLYALVLMYIDKDKAIKGKWRIKENTLITIAAIGGSVGVMISMYGFRHKVRNIKFTIGIPIIIFIQILVITYYIMR